MKKQNRIKKNHEIASIVNLRKKVASKNYVIYYQKNNLNKTRIAFSVSKKFGHAVERNKAKRISRNLFRKYINMYNNLDLVIIIRQNMKNVTFEVLENEVNFLFNLINKNLKKEDKGEKI